MSTAPDRVQLFSGGLDSLCIWHLSDRPQPLYVRFGHPYEDAEIHTLHTLTAALADDGFNPRIVDGPRIGTPETMRDGWIIPHRNLTALLTAAHTYPTAYTLYIGSVADDTAPDASPRFARAATRALSYSDGRRITVHAPARRITKAELVRRFLKAHPTRSHLLHLTRSCYSGTSNHPCGTCRACVRRNIALHTNGLITGPPPPPGNPNRTPPVMRFPRILGGPW